MVKWFPEQDYRYEVFVILEAKLIVCCRGTG